MKTVWNALGDTRLAFILLLAAAATLLTGSFYAAGNFTMFNQLNRMRLQDWLPALMADRPEAVWWIPLLFLIMAALGVNIVICAANRVGRLIRRRRGMSSVRMLYLLMPSLIHFLFLMIMLGHLATFTCASWRTLPVAAGAAATIDADSAAYRIRAVDIQFFPASSALRNRIAQTAVTLVDADDDPVRLAYAHPVCIDGHVLLLDRTRKKNARLKNDRVSPPVDQETCNKANVYREPDRPREAGGQRLLIVSDPGLAVIIAGLSLMMVSMIVFLLLKPVSTGDRAAGTSHTSKTEITPTGG